MTDPEPHWYCLKTQTKHEHIAAAHLRRAAEIDVFCPRIRFRRRTTRGACWFIEALFPGYLFARFDLGLHRAIVQYARGIRTVVHFGDRVPFIDDSVIGTLRAQTDDQEVKTIDPAVNVGDTVEIAEGALAGLSVVVQAVLPARERVRVLLEFLGRTNEVDLDRSSVLLPGRPHLSA